MAIGRTFAEALQKGIRSLESGRFGLNADEDEARFDGGLEGVRTPTPDRLFHVEAALRAGHSVADVYEASGIDPWFCDRIVEIIEMRRQIESGEADLREAKRAGFSN